MDATAMTIVSQLITDARTRFGAANVAALEVDATLLDQAMDQVMAIGGQVSLDGCVVDGVLVRERPADVDVPVVHLSDGREPQLLTPLVED
ncbi:MAG: hypothetical protein EA340_02710 [Nitriliruptor sp.]|nr:MAG: hypothetical protein EA340_02710 [Nitriliruptor sp.]